MCSMKKWLLILVFLLNTQVLFAQEIISNDITQLNPIIVERVVYPKSTDEVIALIKTHAGPIAIAGGKYSMGGQTAADHALQINIKKLNHIINFKPDIKEITVETGTTWRQIQELIDPYNLSVQIMQSYDNFTVGGSLSVNVHGRYVGQGPIILSVKQIKLVLANGSLITASPTQNAPIYYSAIGGYGAMGVITEATLSLVENTKLRRTSTLLPISHYKSFFQNTIINDNDAVFHNTVIYPPDYQTVRAVTYIKTNQPLTITDRLQPKQQSYYLQQAQLALLSKSNLAKQLRKLYDSLTYSKPLRLWRNYEASYSVEELAPISTSNSSFVLQEYFIPIEQFDVFYPQLIRILKSHHVNVINISIRQAKKDPGSYLAWAKTDVFAFVIYYQQGITQQDKQQVKNWTKELITAAIHSGGSYYLPYQIIASQKQFNQAYPRANEFFTLKKQLDPTNKFRNKLLEQYNPQK